MYQNSKDRDKEDFQVFYNYEKFGIKEKNDEKYVYMFISEESYYVKHNLLRSSEGSAMPYKFTFKDDKIINCEISQDGEQYRKSIKDMFPDDIENKILKFGKEKLKVKYDLEEHYS